MSDTNKDLTQIISALSKTIDTQKSVINDLIEDIQLYKELRRVCKCNNKYR